MFDIEAIGEWRGQDVIDPEDTRVGRLEEVYHDRHSNTPGFACVKTGLFGRRLSFVPLAGASMARDHIRVAHTAEEIKRAPSVEPDGRLTAQEEAALFDHYGLQAPVDAGGQSPRLVRYQTDATAAQVAEAHHIVAEQGDVVGGTAALTPTPEPSPPAGPIDADRLGALEERVAAIENWLADRES